MATKKATPVLKTGVEELDLVLEEDIDELSLELRGNGRFRRYR